MVAKSFSLTFLLLALATQKPIVVSFSSAYTNIYMRHIGTESCNQVKAYY